MHRPPTAVVCPQFEAPICPDCTSSVAIGLARRLLLALFMNYLSNIFAAVPCALLLTTGCIAAEDAEPEATHLGPSDGKTDGDSAVTTVLTPDAPDARFEVTCSEWFTCDLQVSITSKGRVPSVLYVTRASDEAVRRYLVGTFPCGDGLDSRQAIIAENQLLSGRQSCESIEQLSLDARNPIAGALLSSPDGEDQFRLRLSHDDWSKGERVELGLRLSWR